MFCQFQPVIVTSFYSFAFTFEYTENKTVTSFTWHHIFSNYGICKVCNQFTAYIGRSFIGRFIISVTTPEGPKALLLFILQIDFTTISVVIRRGGPSTGSAAERSSSWRGNLTFAITFHNTVSMPFSCLLH